MNCQFSWFPADSHYKSCTNLLIAPNQVPSLCWHGVGFVLRNFRTKYVNKSVAACFAHLKGKTIEENCFFFLLSHAFWHLLKFIYNPAVINIMLTWLKSFCFSLLEIELLKMINNNTLYKYCGLFNILINEIFSTPKWQSSELCRCKLVNLWLWIAFTFERRLMG